MKGPSPSPVPSPRSVCGFWQKQTRPKCFPQRPRSFERLKTYGLPREAKLCHRCNVYYLGEHDLLFVSLKKFGVGLHGLLACRILPRRLDDLSPTRLPGREYRSVQQAGLGRRAVPRPALFNLAPSQLVLNIAVCLKLVQLGKAVPQRGKVGLVLLGFFPHFFSVSVTGRGIKTAVQNIFEELWEGVRPCALHGFQEELMRQPRTKVCPSVRRQRGWAGAAWAEFGSVWLEKAASVILMKNINPSGC